jgi:putative addiction module component (TIGR02574 family)
MASVALRHVRDKALELSEDERAELAHDLLESLDGPADDGRDTAWDTEVQDRIAEIDAGTATLVDADEVARRVRAIVRPNQ